MPESRAASSGRLRRHKPKVHPTTIHDPSLDGALNELRAALDLDSLWRASVTALDLMLPVYHHVAAMPCVEDRPIWVSSTIPESAEPGYWDRFISCEPPLSKVLASQPFSKMGYLSDHWSLEELSGTEFYKRVMAPEGWQDAAGFLFWEGMDYLGHIGINRRREDGPFLPHERALLADFYPHLEAAVKRVAAFDRERSRRAALEAVLKETPDGMLILDWELRTTFSNRAAQEACQLWNGDRADACDIPPEVRTAAGNLMASSESLLRQPPPGKLLPLVDQMLHPDIPGLKARIRVLHPRAKQAIKPHCLVEFSRVAQGSSGEPAVAAFSLTTAERRVADLVAMGKTNPTVAKELNLSVNTVRAHLREIFGKLGIHHRGELSGTLNKTPSG